LIIYIYICHYNIFVVYLLVSTFPLISHIQYHLDHSHNNHIHKNQNCPIMLCTDLTNSMELSPSSEAVSHSAIQEFYILQNPIQINLVRITYSLYSRPILILSSHLSIRLLRNIFPSNTLTENLYAFFFSKCVLHILPFSSSLV
jgi:hypothetical protein